MMECCTYSQVTAGGTACLPTRFHIELSSSSSSSTSLATSSSPLLFQQFLV